MTIRDDVISTAPVFLLLLFLPSFNGTAMRPKEIGVYVVAMRYAAHSLVAAGPVCLGCESASLYFRVSVLAKRKFATVQERGCATAGADDEYKQKGPNQSAVCR